MRRLLQTLLLALLLVSVQSASIGHQHADRSLPAGHQATVCDLCTAFQTGAPAPEPAVAPRPAATPLLLAAGPQPPYLTASLARAHRSRAPPLLHSS